MPIRRSTGAAKHCKGEAPDARTPLGPEYETQRALWMLRLLLKASSRDRPPSSLDDALEELGLGSEKADRLSPARVRRWLEDRLQQLEQRELAEDSIGQNTRWLAQWLGLSEGQRKVLAFAATAESSQALQYSLKPFQRLSSGLAIQLLGDVLGEPIELVRAGLSPQSQLVRSGMLQFQPGQDSHRECWIGLQSPFDTVFAAHYERPEELFAAVCPRASEPELGLDAFAHLSRDLDLLSSLLRGASLERVPGINVLVHGPPGSGKSQLVRSVARALSLPLYQVPDIDSNGDVLAGKKRLAVLSTMQYLLDGGTPGLVLFDEIEDAFPWEIESGWLRQGSGSDKARTNRLLEENAVPCLWVGNRIGQLDPAFVRRFSLVVEVPAPPRKIREGMLANYSQGLEVPAELRNRLADNAWVMPSDVARAACVTRLVQKGRARETLTDAQVFERALCGGRRSGPERGSPGELDYDLALVNTSVPLERLTLGLKQRGEGCVCLYGPPGTGKTAFARQLANALERPLLHHSAGDLLDMYVGGTEKAIVEMFEEASRSDCVLLLDEVEGLMRDRGGAVRGFEVTQVNELLVRMEAFRGIFLCATNGFEALDPASLRRFALRVEFSPLDGDQNLLLLERTARKLGLELTTEAARSARSRLSRLRLLTPGDYASVLRGRLLLGEPSVEALVSDLERAHAEKRSQGRIGFRS
ncbi:MAG: ATP-binding protein [Deltaproteobacteria bacterium]